VATVLPRCATSSSTTSTSSNPAASILTGAQAFVRLLILQRQRDALAGLNTGGFVSGYRGSPLGALDQSLWKAQKFLERANVVFQPGLNEDLAATSIWGTQQVNLHRGAKVDGVFAMWYGKGPGVDRCGDVFKHANFAGTSKHGGVLVLAGDDHAAKSSTVPHQSDHQFSRGDDAGALSVVGAGDPRPRPARLGDVALLRLLGRLQVRRRHGRVELVGVDRSRAHADHRADDFPCRRMACRFAGPMRSSPPRRACRTTRSTRRCTTAASISSIGSSSIRRARASASRRRARATRTCARRSTISASPTRTRRRSDCACTRSRCRGRSSPKACATSRKGLEEILVVEEKRQVVEYQLKEQLYNWRDDVRPRVVGKFDEKGEWVARTATGCCRRRASSRPAMIARVIAKRMERLNLHPRRLDELRTRVDWINAKEKALARPKIELVRQPYFCSGCPHNTSTRVPEGSRATAGIGCHVMAIWMDRGTGEFTQMGGEGVPWIGQAPFTEEKHIFANLGDGTYYHSGLLAVRAAVAANVNITYKILYNDAVAMTGGQPIDGPLTPQDIARQVAAEGVKRIVVVTDEPTKYPSGYFRATSASSSRRARGRAARAARDSGVTV
jgi:indolepyruvate ferredoxin oxidoreductase